MTLRLKPHSSSPARSGEEPVISIAEARRALSGALSGEAPTADGIDPAAVQLRQHAQQQQHLRQQHAQHAQHAHQAHQQQQQQMPAPIGRTVSAAELRSLAAGSGMRLTSGAQVRYAA